VSGAAPDDFGGGADPGSWVPLAGEGALAHHTLLFLDPLRSSSLIDFLKGGESPKHNTALPPDVGVLAIWASLIHTPKTSNRPAA
jgi:hypothetical protein